MHLPTLNIQLNITWSPFCLTSMPPYGWHIWQSGIFCQCAYIFTRQLSQMAKRHYHELHRPLSILCMLCYDEYYDGYWLVCLYVCMLAILRKKELLASLRKRGKRIFGMDPTWREINIGDIFGKFLLSPCIKNVFAVFWGPVGGRGGGWGWGWGGGVCVCVCVWGGGGGGGGGGGCGEGLVW